MGKEDESVKVTRRLRKAVWSANDDFGMVKEGDKIMVCLSGGKDSYAMLDILIHMKSSPLLDFDIVAWMRALHLLVVLSSLGRFRWP